ncbi:sigma-54-dependent Fis family transcriptional regulator [Endozoicomonas sp. OPT23]|uniref:sigma-54-dependent transcriptional regulator n=1 Tax=Endozoicomonas sp. OPT23 TaxID=2072845 RepID=UPI00129AA49B|nr:sigma-54 dependent transcriptional regulator [Endozoicomonas sp. OPT23]MRI31769.1 sigma-54-dependent Fis family transcriptional regulator [Endozoicomonas sp. OPT23]
MNSKPTLLITDDEVRLARSLEIALFSNSYRIITAHTAADAIELAISEHPEVVLLDLKLPDSDQLEPLNKLKVILPESKIIMMSAHGDIQIAVEAVKQGAYDFITKPFDVDAIRSRITPWLESCSEQVPEPRKFVGQSFVLKSLLEQIKLIAQSPARNILLKGESGTGKTAIAHEIHCQSDQAEAPFIEVNCAALPETLLEAELFGAEKGAYTGAHKRRKGLIEQADGGTLFLDEIGELSLATQAKLLTFLESYRYRPVGSEVEKEANIRVIAATNRDLKQASESGEFRSDLYFRLNIMPITLPPLKQRLEDVPELLKHFAELMAKRQSTTPIQFDNETLSVLTLFPWPGNIRELRNIVERLSVLYPGTLITESRLPAEVFNSAQSIESKTPVVQSDTNDDSELPESMDEYLATAEREIILKALRQTSGHKTKAAELLNISRHAFKRRLQKLGIKA